MTAEIWRNLGIPETDNEQEVRRAYAERLKRTNPEDDRFKRLRASYERALQNIRWRVRFAAHDGAGDDGAGDGADFIDAAEAPGEPAPGAMRPPRPASALRPPEEPPARDEALEAHAALRKRLEHALGAGASPWEVQAAFQALAASPAMERLIVYVATEAWVANLIRQYSGGGLLLDAAIAHFKWDDRSSVMRGGIGEIMQGFRKSLALEQKSRAFIARVRDPRHEFHAAYKQVARPLSERNWLSRLASFHRIGLVRRFLDYLDDKIPYGDDELDYESSSWWRRRIDFWMRPLAIAAWVLRVGFVVGIIALFGIAFSGDEGRSGVYAARRACTAAVATTDFESDACAAFLEQAPDSLLMRQYAGIIALRAGRLSDALSQFEAIARISPLDAAARYGKGLALSRSADLAEQELGVELTREALAIDRNVGIYFAQYGIEAAPNLTPVEAYAPFPPAPIPPFDTRPSGIAAGDRNSFDAAYGHFGIAEPFRDGRVIVQCLARATGHFSDCRIVEEDPRNAGRGEMAIRIMASARVSPARNNGEVVDGFPVQIPVRFAETPGDGAQ